MSFKGNEWVRVESWVKYAAYNDERIAGKVSNKRTRPGSNQKLFTVEFLHLESDGTLTLDWWSFDEEELIPTEPTTEEEAPWLILLLQE